MGMPEGQPSSSSQPDLEEGTFDQRLKQDGIVFVVDPLHGGMRLPIIERDKRLVTIAPDGKGGWGEYTIEKEYAIRNYKALRQKQNGQT